MSVNWGKSPKVQFCRKFPAETLQTPWLYESRTTSIYLWMLQRSDCTKSSFLFEQFEKSSKKRASYHWKSSDLCWRVIWFQSSQMQNGVRGSATSYSSARWLKTFSTLRVNKRVSLLEWTNISQHATSKRQATLFLGGDTFSEISLPWIHQGTCRSI